MIKRSNGERSYTFTLKGESKTIELREWGRTKAEATKRMKKNHHWTILSVRLSTAAECGRALGLLGYVAESS